VSGYGQGLYNCFFGTYSKLQLCAQVIKSRLSDDVAILE
jgi:hypothetical protein